MSRWRSRLQTWVRRWLRTDNLNRKQKSHPVSSEREIRVGLHLIVLVYLRLPIASPGPGSPPPVRGISGGSAGGIGFT